MSPKDFLSRKKSPDDNENVSSSRCSICLGDLDPDDPSPNLRILNCCANSMHAACLETWLSTKTSCPCCKHDLGGY